ncbi:eCIS core domain-containing protein [Haliangium sp.]|uniref:eCIS core domain-containing protein n=1 Tax=Haliangium sp. TaxID=2663208 RepID=UPI003D0E6F04
MDGDQVHRAAAAGVSGSGGSLPHLDRIQQSFGSDYDVSNVKAHVGGAAAEASASIGASAYATGHQIAFQSAPDLHTAAHEAAHVIQQQQGVHLRDGVGQAGDVYERHADAVADRVVARESAAELLAAGPSGGNQKADAATDGLVQNQVVQRQEGGLPSPPLGDEDLRGLSKEQLQELYDKLRKSHPSEAEKVKRWQKSKGYRGSSEKRKRKKFKNKKKDETKNDDSNQYSYEKVLDVVIALGLSVAMVAVIAAALLDPEPASKLALAGLSVVMIIAVLDAFGIEHDLKAPDA